MDRLLFLTARNIAVVLSVFLCGVLLGLHLSDRREPPEPPTPIVVTTTPTADYLGDMQEAEWMCKIKFRSDPEARACQVLKENPDYEPYLPDHP